MPKYCKKPVVIDAVKWEGDLIAVYEALSPFTAGTPSWHENDGGQLVIGTLEGEMAAERGDWIIKGVEGEVYPCKPSIFEATYEPAEPGDTTAEEHY